MNSSTARINAMKLVYENEMGGNGGEDTFAGILELKPGESGKEYMLKLYDGVCANKEALDARLSEHLRGWTLERISKVDLAILRVAAFEILNKLVKPAIAINEAVEMANHYSSDRAGAFINGVLGNLNREMQE